MRALPAQANGCTTLVISIQTRRLRSPSLQAGRVGRGWSAMVEKHLQHNGGWPSQDFMARAAARTPVKTPGTHAVRTPPKTAGTRSWKKRSSTSSWTRTTARTGRRRPRATRSSSSRLPKKTARASRPTTRRLRRSTRRRGRRRRRHHRRRGRLHLRRRTSRRPSRLTPLYPRVRPTTCGNAAGRDDNIKAAPRRGPAAADARVGPPHERYAVATLVLFRADGRPPSALNKNQSHHVDGVASMA